MELEFRRDGQAFAHTKPELPAPDAAGRVTYVGSVTTGSLEPGLYEVWVRGRQGDAEATEATAFTITPRPPLAAGLFAPGAIEDRENVAIPLTTILERASRYVREYEGTFRDLVADESYRQWGPDPKGGPAPVARTLRSDLVFIRLRGPLPWGTFRDVYEVDGQAVRDRDRRLERLLSATGAPEVGRARAILDEGARYNLGPYRNVNAPTLGLLFLRSENQARLAFKRKGTRTIAGFPAVEVAFEEKARPTIIHDPRGDDVPASGRFWIDATRGTVLRTEIAYDLEPDKSMHDSSGWSRGAVATEYRREVSLGAFVPDTMTELYYFRTVGRIEAVARYGSYRRFEVSVETEAALP